MSTNIDESDVISELFDDSGLEGETNDSDADPDYIISDKNFTEDWPSNNRTPLQEKQNAPKPAGKPSVEALGWTSVDTMHTLPTFEERAGVTCDINETSSPLDCFSIFLPSSMVRHIKKETNQYAAAIVTKLRHSNKLKANSLVITGPRNLILCTPFPSAVMSHDRFKAVLSNLHLNDNNNYIAHNQPNHDPLFKLRYCLDHLLPAFPASLAPCPPYIYMKGKPEKYGMKLFVVCDACTGYVLQMEVYAGNGAQETGVLSVLYRLLSDNYGKCFTFYGPSHVIFDFLWEKKTKAVGYMCVQLERTSSK
ncbi:hypothetical protein PR048_015590 [Dryococelus australis]|uniref:PiggyBac transposable element-derived protein domain-containing protein n=1 Tax=Dryococelus australis TaxID=614101 RepID=A0ABQ9HHC7_9NEOP|nr:hypothetical protein PR048_015590 [Dryococelus australis]